MQAPAIPASEERRLSTLRALGLLDTPPDRRFDAVTRAAARLFAVPIALITLVDDQRQWFKSRVGLEAAETHRDISFCGHAIHGRDIFLVPDAVADARFASNPLVTGDPGIRFYAGRPLAAPNGEMLGTLCLIDRKPRALDAAQLALLQDLGAWAEAEIALISQCDSVNRFLDRLLDQFSEPVLLADETATIRYANPAALKLLGWAPGEIAGRPLHKIFPEQERLRFEVEASAILRADGGMTSLEHPAVILRRDASEFRVTLAFFRMMAAGRGVTAVILRPAWRDARA